MLNYVLQEYLKLKLLSVTLILAGAIFEVDDEAENVDGLQGKNCLGHNST